MAEWLSIREVVSQTGVPAATLRAWERRYGFPVPQRTSGGHRRYDAADVERLRQAHDLVERGWAASSAVRQVQATALEDVAVPGATLVAVMADHANAHEDVDTDVLLLLTRTLRQLVRATSPDQVRTAVHEAVEAAGGTLVPAESAGTDALPIDVAFGEGGPLLPQAEPFTLARMRLESILPQLVQDAQTSIDRLRVLALGQQVVASRVDRPQG